MQALCLLIFFFNLSPNVNKSIKTLKKAYTGYITKTRLFKYTENFTAKKRKNEILIFFIFLLKT